MLTERLTASGAIISARTARACDGCMIRRARWFCASDDAFLCHSCDASVHSANQLASRHERVPISSAELSKPASAAISVSDCHQKVTRRARTPGSNGLKAKSLEMKEACSLVVPEIGFEDGLSCENDECEDLMVFQVPVFDADCWVWNENESASVEELHSLLDFVSDDIQFTSGDDEALIGGVGAEFLCDVELEMLDCIKGKKMDVAGLESERNMRVKMEDADNDEIETVLAYQYDTELIDLGSRESLLDWDFGLESDEMAVKEEGLKLEGSGLEEVAFGKRMLLLNLNCDEVVSAWDNHGCPWMNGTRPVFDHLGDGWPQFSGIKDSCSGHGTSEDENGGRSVSGGRMVSEERVASVTRYREKRRTRLFSKKIRYEVRKLNAEKRPRMKGRFCKRIQSYVGPQVNSLK